MSEGPGVWNPPCLSLPIVAGGRTQLVGSKQKLVRCPQPFWGWQGLRRRRAEEEEARESSISPPGLGQVRPFYSHD